MNLLERIDLALQHARASRGDLAKAIDVSTQAISNLKRRPGSTMRPEHVARAARFLRCDLYWLCTGEPSEYVPERTQSNALPWGYHACEVARWVESLPQSEQERAFARIYKACADIHAERPLPLTSSDGTKARGSPNA